MTTKEKEVKGNFFTRAFMKDGSFLNVVEKQKCRSASTKLKSKYNSMYNNLVDTISNNATSLYDLKIDVENYDIRKVLELKQELRDQVTTLKLIKVDYREMFDVDFKSELSVEEFLVDVLGEDLASSVLVE